MAKHIVLLCNGFHYCGQMCGQLHDFSAEVIVLIGFDFCAVVADETRSVLDTGDCDCCNDNTKQIIFQVPFIRAEYALSIGIGDYPKRCRTRRYRWEYSCPYEGLL